MADEILRLGIDGRPAREGAAEVKRALDDVKKSAEGAAGAVDDLGGARGGGAGRAGLVGLGGAASTAATAIGVVAAGAVAFRIGVSQGARVTRQWADELDRLAQRGDDWGDRFRGQVGRVSTAFDRLDRLIDQQVRGTFASFFDELIGGDGKLDLLERGVNNFFTSMRIGAALLKQIGTGDFVGIGGAAAAALVDTPGGLPVGAGAGSGRRRADLVGSVTEFSDRLLRDSQRAERERFDNLVRATELRRAETDELRELLRLSLQYSAELEQGNVSLARRVELAERLRQINGAFTPTGGIAGSLPQSGFLGVNAPGSVSLSPGNAAILAGIRARNAQGAQRAIAEAESARSLILFTAGLDEAAFQLSQFSPELGRFTSGIADVLAGIQRSRAGGIEGALGTIGIVGAGIGLAAQLGRALFGGSQEESPAQREARRIQAENNARIAELTQGIARLNGGVLGIAGSDFTRAFNLTDPFTRDFGTNGGSAGDAFRELVRATKAVNDNFGLLERVARSLGLEFDGGVESVRALNAALQTEFLSQFSNTFGGRFDILQTRFGLLGTSPNDQFDALRREIQDLVSGDLGAEIGGLNRDNFRTFAAEFLDRLRAGDQSIFADLGDVSIEEFLSFLRAAGGALDGLEEAASSATDALRNVPEVFKVAASTFLASDSRDPIFRPVGTGGEGSRVNVEVTINTTGGVSEEDAVRAAQIVTDQILQSQRRGGTSAFDLAVTSSSRSGLKGGY